MLVGWNKEFEKEFDELVAYHVEHNRDRVPPTSTPSGLGAWVNSQRRALKTMAPDLHARL
jgi:hypothetical protein